MNTALLDWNDFEDAINQALDYLEPYRETLTGVYGVPRGGVCLAVVLSHHLGIPYLQTPQDGCLIVDDIFQTGTTMITEAKKVDTCLTWTWIKIDPSGDDQNYAIGLSEGTWVIFPWEDPDQAEKDKEDYERRLAEQTSPEKVH